VELVKSCGYIDLSSNQGSVLSFDTLRVPADYSESQACAAKAQNLAFGQHMN